VATIVKVLMMLLKIVLRPSASLRASGKTSVLT
jgi:hypothetical protein